MHSKVVTWLAIFFGIIGAAVFADLFREKYGRPKSDVMGLGVSLLCVFIFFSIARLASQRHSK